MIWNKIELLHAALLLLLLLILTWYWLSRTEHKRRRLPPGPPGWPIVGNLPLLASKQPYRKLAALSNAYGSPLVSLRLGSKQAMVVCTAEMAREVLQTHDSTFSNRPEFGMADHLLFGEKNIIGFQNSGARWREMRKLWTTQLLSQAMMAKNQHVRQEEVANMLAAIKAEAEASREGAAGVKILNCVAHVTGNIMGRLVISQRLFESVREPHRLHSITEKTLNLMFTPLVGDFVPLLSVLDVPTKRRMAVVRAEVEDLMASIISDRVGAQKKSSNDILDLLLNQAAGVFDAESRGFISGTLLEMFIAGVDTSANTVTWAMAELLSNPSEMVKVQSELQEVVGLNRTVLESDLPRLHYLKAIIKETFRLHPIAVMMIPHVSKEPCQMGGYFIPAQTRVFINLWALGRDTFVWEHPYDFLPQRFMDCPHIDVKGQHFGLIPFGSGRRMCPGMNQGLTVVELTLANLVHTFDWSLSRGQIVDLSESTSTAGSLTMANPLIAIPSYRLNVPTV